MISVINETSRAKIVISWTSARTVPARCVPCQAAVSMMPVESRISLLRQSGPLEVQLP